MLSSEMLTLLICVCVITCPVFVYSSDEPCVTPNGETATCIYLDHCKVIKEAITSGDEIAIKFYTNSRCGTDKLPFVCCGSTGYPAGPKKHTKLPGRNVCGLQITDERVLGGQLTGLGEFPWLALLGYKNAETEEMEYKCGGTLINPRYVLTAAHCIRVRRGSSLTLDTVRLGEWRISTEEDCLEDLANDECADPVLDLKIELKVPHSGYSRASGNNDIGLLRLERNIQYTNYIRAICLPTANSPDPSAGAIMTVSGWGATENGSNSDVKLKLDVPIVARGGCAAKIMVVGQVTENQVCAGGEKGKDTCQGDSGGPLMATFAEKVNTKHQWYQTGVIAYGIGCGRKDFPGVYTYIPKYMDWILDNIADY